MIQANFTIFDINQDATIDVRNISAMGGYYDSTLRIPIHFKLRPGNFLHKPRGFYLTQLEGKLRFAHANGLSVRGSKMLDIEVGLKDSTPVVYFDFEIDQRKLDHLETCRDGGIKFNLELKVQYWLAEEYMIHGDKGASNEFRPFRLNITQINVFSEIEIPQSEWISKFLPNWGWNPYKLVELPIASEIIPEQYAKSLAELKEAERLFNLGEYDQSVGKCRSALDPLKENVKLIRGYIASEVEREWAGESLTASWEWIEKLFKRTQRLASKPHHPPSYGHFDRSEAQIIYLTTTAIIAYVGKVTVNPSEN
jgi:hypothetical protein